MLVINFVFLPMKFCFEHNSIIMDFLCSFSVSLVLGRFKLFLAKYNLINNKAYKELTTYT